MLRSETSRQIPSPGNRIVTTAPDNHTSSEDLPPFGAGIDALRDALAERVEAIASDFREAGQTVIAFSGGVDSSTVAALAHRVLGDDALAVTAVSETLPDRELREARAVADHIGLPHECMSFSELEDPRFRENTAARCFFCQSMRFDQLASIADRVDSEMLASGTNASDAGDHRPGLQAMEERGVYQPLLEYEIPKPDVRRIARVLGLPVWNKPAKACLSSRIPHGLPVTEESLERIEAAEDVLYERDFDQFRVRDHDGLARVEVAPNELARLIDNPDLWDTVATGIRRTGFDRVVLDLEGYRSGSLNPESTST